MPTPCPWCLDLGTPIHRISRTAIIHHKTAWLARQGLRQTSGHGAIPDSSSNRADESDIQANQELRQTSGHSDIPDSSSSRADNSDIQANNTENGGYESPTPDLDDGGESPGAIEPCKPIVYLPSALLSRVRPPAYRPKY
jgi:hypothetical protein